MELIVNTALTFLQSPSTNPAKSPAINCENFPPACISSISDLSGILIPLILTLSAIVLLGILIKASYTVLTAGGDPQKIEEAKHSMSFAVLGMIVIFLAFFIVRLITSLLDIPFLL